ncbi:MAG: type I 3-dehydroquinate dehydratase, partial [Acidobacteriota bacterium]
MEKNVSAHDGADLTAAPDASAGAPARATLVASLTHPPSDSGDELRDLPDGVEYLEVRSDLLGELDPAWLRDRFPGKLIYTLRSKAEGGRFEGGVNARGKRFKAAAEAGYELIDLEADRDLRAETLLAVPAERRLLSWHGSSPHLTSLKQRLEELSKTRARFYKLIPHASQSGDDIRCLALLEGLEREDVICFATGEVGTWTRVLAPRLGCPLIYASFGDTPAAPGQLSVETLVRDFGFPELRPMEGLYGIVGRPVAQSLSPRLYNGAFREFGLPGVYVPFHIESFGDFWIDVIESGSLEQLGFSPRGLSITSPYKSVALAVSGASSPRAQHIEAANSMFLHDRVWQAETTDLEGVVEAFLNRGVTLRGAKAAVVGCGGAGKAAAYGLQLAGAKVTLVNRGRERGESASVSLRLPFVPLKDFDPARVDLVVQATDVGRNDSDPLIIDPERLPAHGAVFDMVYRDRPTRL